MVIPLCSASFNMRIIDWDSDYWHISNGQYMASNLEWEDKSESFFIFIIVGFLTDFYFIFVILITFTVKHFFMNLTKNLLGYYNEFYSLSKTVLFVFFANNNNNNY